MTTPTREAVVQKAQELYLTEQYKNGIMQPNTPEDQELLEGGFYATALSELMTDTAARQTEQWNNYNRLTENFEKTEQCDVMQEIPFNIAEAKDAGIFTCGANQSRKTTLNKHLVKAMIEQNIIVNVLDISRAWSENTPISQTITIPDVDRPDIEFDIGKNIVFDMSELSLKHRLEFANAFTQTIYDWQKSFGYKRAPFRFVVYEEAQGYIANGSFRSLKKFSPIVDMISVGANFNIRAALITPFPANVDKTPVKSAQQRYFGRTTEPNDIKYIRALIGKDMVSELKDLQNGEFLYQRGTQITKFSVPRFGNIKSSSNVQWKTRFSFPLVI
jgi:hypothetical protein